MMRGGDSVAQSHFVIETCRSGIQAILATTASCYYRALATANLGCVTP